MAHSLSHSAADPELSSVSYSDLEEPCSDCHEALLSQYHQPLDSSSTDQCAACSHRQQRSKMASVVLLVWAVPLALAGGRWYGLWGPMHHTVNDNPRGHLILAQVIFRHGARTPLSNLYWPNTTWMHCSHHPLAAPSSSSSSSSSRSSSSKGIKLQPYDPSGAPKPPELSGDEEPDLPGGCKMGSLTDNGYQMALDLGARLRRTYIDQHKLLPARQLDAQLLHVESTAVQRTVTTLRGVLNGLYPNSTAAVKVAVRPYAQETMIADWQGCPVLGNLSQQLITIQNTRDADDPLIQELQHQARSGLQLPPDSPLNWNRLRDELACMEAEGQSPPVAAQQQRLIRHIDFVNTQRTVQISAPELGDCLLGRDQQQQCQQVTALTSGRLLNAFISNMNDAAARNNHRRAAQGANISSRSDLGALTVALPAASGRRLLVSNAAAAERTASSSDWTEGALQQQQRQQQRQQGPKLMLFSAHDTTLLPLLSALGQHQTAWPAFTSHLAFELWQHKGQFYVRVLHDGEPLRLPVSSDDSSDTSMGGGEGGGSARDTVFGQLSEGVWGALSTVLARLQGFVKQLVAAVDVWVDHIVETMSGIVGVGEGGKRLQTNGQGEYSTTAYVVSLEDFQQQVVKEYVLTSKGYASACTAGGTAYVGQGGQARPQWLSQFY